MEMEACTVTGTGTGTHEFVGSSPNISDATHILIKGKRTKRQRPLSPSPNSAVNVAVPLPTNTVITSSSSSASEDACATRDVSGGGGGDCGSFSSTTATYESTEEEEDMANCLILLAQGDAGAPRLHKFHQIQAQADNNKTEQKGSSRIRFGEMATVSATASSKMVFDIYECKTCNRTFSSFQALGGHRASHKKPKVSSPSSSSPDEKKQPSPPALALPQPQPQPQPDYDFEEAVAHIKTWPPHQISLQLPSNRSGFNTSLNLNNKAAKLHECSICGSEFTSGQALGGHMRRHRASTRTSSDQVAASVGPAEEATCHTSPAVNVRVKPRNILSLDLNLPAPEDDLRESKFQFVPTQKAMVLSAPALVDCHY
ncbi:hypothetical protein L6164_022035 [Bauhinia variegata]|uniref:Uncharacterized protein n=1 Tax=Bauhinia variegata TaxID=167791 RepID=A0ACB9MDY5_BAUVA|nr:hypothetical protein L6164_022035 [Bauhinia variegata]